MVSSRIFNYPHGFLLVVVKNVYDVSRWQLEWQLELEVHSSNDGHELLIQAMRWIGSATYVTIGASVIGARSRTQNDCCTKSCRQNHAFFFGRYVYSVNELKTFFIVTTIIPLWLTSFAVT